MVWKGAADRDSTSAGGPSAFKRIPTVEINNDSK